MSQRNKSLQKVSYALLRLTEPLLCFNFEFFFHSAVKLGTFLHVPISTQCLPWSQTFQFVLLSLSCWTETAWRGHNTPTCTAPVGSRIFHQHTCQHITLYCRPSTLQNLDGIGKRSKHGKGS